MNVNLTINLNKTITSTGLVHSTLHINECIWLIGPSWSLVLAKTSIPQPLPRTPFQNTRKFICQNYISLDNMLVKCFNLFFFKVFNLKKSNFFFHSCFFPPYLDNFILKMWIVVPKLGISKKFQSFEKKKLISPCWS